MARFVLSRAVKAVLTVWIAITATFFLLRLLPGDPTTLMVEGDMTPEMQAALLKTYGLDRPLWEQYVSYLRELTQGNFGISFRQIQPVTDILVDRLPWTLLLAGTAFLVTIAIGIPIGVYAAVHRGRWPDKILQAAGIGGHALFVPSVAMLLLVYLGARLGWFPIGGAIDPDTRGLAAYASLAHHLVLPVASLVLVQLGPYALTLRTNMIEVLGEDYIRAARARGLSTRRRVWKHGLRNAI
ncbi:ABC transporter permease, partial [Micromonospora fluostatini]